MRQMTTDLITELLAEQESPCVSLYQPTHRRHPENQQDPIRYRNLLRQMETTLQQKYSQKAIDPLLKQFQAFAHDDLFWNHRTDGLAILATPKMFQVLELQRAVPELLVVAESFHVKPLLRITQSADRYQILCLNRHSAKLYEGNRDALDLVEMTDVPTTITEALGAELTEPHQTVASYGTGPSGAGSAMHHGHGAKTDEVDIDRDRFFRAVDRGVLEHHSRSSGLPLMLAALAEYHAPFRALSHNPNLVSGGITTNPDALDLDRLRTEAWQQMQPHYLARLERIMNDYRVALSREMGSEDLSEVARAAISGRVGMLLVEANREIPGRILHDTGKVIVGNSGEAGLDDALDDLAEMALRMKGEVIVVPSNRMPTTTGLAAIYRY